MDTELRVFHISAKTGASGLLRIPKPLANEFVNEGIVQGRARIPNGHEYPVVLNPFDRTLDGLKNWLRSLSEDEEYHSLRVELRNRSPLSITIEPSTEPVSANEIGSTTSVSRPEEGLYLGRWLEDNFNELIPTEKAFTLDETDLLTHVFICGVTGAGKTVLGKILLEEATLKGIPAIAVDLKGDISSLALMMTGDNDEEIIPFVHPGPNTTKEEEAARITAEHRRKLGSWGLSPEFVREARQSIVVNVFTPRSNNGLRLALSAFPDLPENIDGVRESDADVHDSLLEFLTKQFVARLSLNRNRAEKAEGYLFEILKTCFRRGIPMHGYDGVKKALEEFRSPGLGIDQIGGLETEDYISPNDRQHLASAVNGLLTGAARRMYEGWPVDIDDLTNRQDMGGRVPISIINVSHLDFADQAYVVGYLAHLIGFWMRRLPGTYTPRLVFYVDEIGGGGGKAAFFPSVAVSPCKPALTTLLRQGRAYGVSCIFATQNPGDIDYKGLSNCGTWLVGRLRTRLDRSKIEQGAADADLEFESAKRYLPSLNTGQFVVKTPSKPWSIVQERWLLSLHRPLESNEIKQLKATYEDGAALLVRDAQGMWQRGIRSNAISLLRQAISEYPFSSIIATGCLLLARVLIDDEKYGDAIHELEELLKRWITDEELAEAKFLMGSCHERVGDFEKASSTYAEAHRVTTNPDVKERARTHVEYCDARGTWPKLGLGGKLIWWISGRRPAEGELQELYSVDSEILTRVHQTVLDTIDLSLPPEFDYAKLAEAHQSADVKTEELDAEMVRIRDWAEKQTIKMKSLRSSGNLETAANLARQITQRLLDAELSASESLLSELRITWEAVTEKRQTVCSRVTQVEARQFEYEIARLLSVMGYRTDVTRATGDDGVDVFARKDGEKVVVQCKRWKGRVVGRSIIDELGGTAKRYEATHAIIATTSSFSPDARRAAEQLNIEMWDFDHLTSLMRKYAKGSLEG